MPQQQLITKNIQYIPTENLNPYQNNAKKHPKKQVQQIAASIQQFGFINPIIVNSNKEIIAGHGRLEGAKVLKLKQVPVILVDHLSDAEVRAYRLADNQLTMNTGYDNGLLKIELEELSFMELEFDLEITGFETAQIDNIIDGAFDENDPADDVSDIDEPINPVTQLGDVWQLGKHKLICGDSTKLDAYESLMGKDKAQAVFTDPPYNVPVDGHVCGNGKVKHKEFAMASGEMTQEQFIQFLAQFMNLSVQFSKDGSLHYVCMDWRHIGDLIQAGEACYTEMKNICVWNKDNGGMGTLYRSKHEFVAVFKHGDKPHINNIELGKYGRYRTNVWDYKGVNSFGKNQSDLKMHPTVKPVALIMDAIKDCTRKDHIVLDPFAGSGSTLIACEKTRRVARCIELDPVYCDVIIQRWQKLTGENAVHIESGETFEQKREVEGEDDE
ncbi:MAG: DNA methylase N-4 [Magnetococcales bacterium]|nr:DNA methylase N-4 [Magnetococcales bacterium]